MSAERHSPLPFAKRQRDRSSVWLTCAASSVLLVPPVLLAPASRTVAPGLDALQRGRWTFPEHDLQPACYLGQSEGMCHEVLAPCECVRPVVRRNVRSWILPSDEAATGIETTRRTDRRIGTECETNWFETKQARR